jgi:hypothetical protein
MQILSLNTIMSMAVVIPLTISTATEPSFGENPLLDLPLLSQRDLRLELVNLPGHIRPNLTFELLFPG